MARDHYAALGVSENASAEEIKRAYRNLARQLHPDRNPGDSEAEERFKEVTHAYEVLSDPEKKQRYDTYGDDRAAGPGFGDFGGISDLFATFFGGATQGPQAQSRGADVLAEVELTLEEAAEGVERDVEMETLASCEECGGSGAAPGTHPERCSDCGGTGEIREVRRTMLGNMMTASPCVRCQGSGQMIPDPCPNCSGSGRVREIETLTVHIPAGVDTGARLRVTGRGQAGWRGGRSGDLYVQIIVLPHEIFRRAGDDLACEVQVPMTVAALGGKVTVPMLDGEHELDIEPGTQSGHVEHLRGEGMPRLSGRGRGELIAVLKVLTPTGLDAEQAELLERFANLRDENTGGTRGFFDRIKEAFN